MPAESGGEPSATEPDRPAATARRAVPTLSWPWAVLVVALAVFALLGWQGISTVGRTGPLDAGEYLLNAQYLNGHGHLPPDYVSYEYSAPPLYEALAIGTRARRSRRAGCAARARLEHGRSDPLAAPRRGGRHVPRLDALARSDTRARGPRRSAVCGRSTRRVALGRSQTWSAGQMLSLVAAMGLVVVSALIAREIWPGRPRRMLGTAAFVLAYPVVLRLGVLFHPETTVALLSAIAILLLLRAGARGWPLGLGIAAGVACGLGLLTRQSAVVVVALPRRRRPARGRPQGCALHGRPGRRDGSRRGAVARIRRRDLGQPVPGKPPAPRRHGPGRRAALVLRLVPDRVARRAPLPRPPGEPVPAAAPRRSLERLVRRLPQRVDRARRAPTASPPRARASWASRPTRSPSEACSPSASGRCCACSADVRVSQSDGALGFLALLAAAAVVALAAQIIRYPQVDGKEIKASYLMFTAPCWAVFSVAAWTALWRRPTLRIVLAIAASLYVLSYGTSLAASFSHSYPSLPDIVESQGYTDLSVSISQLSPTPGAGRRGRLRGLRREPRDGDGHQHEAGDRPAPGSEARRAADLRPWLGLHRPHLGQLLPRFPAVRQELDHPVRHADHERL